MRIKLYTLTFIWLAILSLSFYFSFQSARENQKNLLLKTSRTAFAQILATREWNNVQGGVYAIVSDEIRPDTHLKDPQRDLICEGKIPVTKITSSYMTRMISELMDQDDGLQFHMTSLNPIREQNLPDEWEKNALMAFSSNTAVEKSDFSSHTTPSYYRYMAPLKAYESCLKCHSKQNVSKNDILGGISIKLFDIPPVKLLPIILNHGVIGLFVLFIILFYGLKLIKAHDKIQYQAAYDILTDIPNRRYCNEQLHKEFDRSIRHNTSFSLILADIDLFKNYNMIHGPEKGNTCLQMLAQQFKKTLKRPADFCGRWGGEEFMMILPVTSRDGAEYIAKKLIADVRALNIRHDASEIEPYITLSLGVVSEEEKKSDVKTLLKKVNTALTRAKSNGRNRFEIHED